LPSRLTSLLLGLIGFALAAFVALGPRD